MKALLDTHALLWWLFDDPRLSPVARAVIAEPRNQILVSAASGWEIATKHRIGKLPEAGDVPQRLAHYLGRARLMELPISIEHAITAGALPGPHRDPFDRMLIAQTRIEHIPVITQDRVFDTYEVDVIWS